MKIGTPNAIRIKECDHSKVIRQGRAIAVLAVVIWIRGANADRNSGAAKAAPVANQAVHVVKGRAVEWAEAKAELPATRRMSAGAHKVAATPEMQRVAIDKGKRNILAGVRMWKNER